jgi:hypothetical protein
MSSKFVPMEIFLFLCVALFSLSAVPVFAFDWNFDEKAMVTTDNFELDAVTSLTYLKVNDILSMKAPQAVSFDKKNNLYIGTCTGFYMNNYTSKAVTMLNKGNTTG